MVRIRKVEEFGEGYILITDLEDVRSVLESIGDDNSWEESSFLFVKIVDCDYEEVWIGEGIPYVHKYCRQIW